MLLVVDAGNTNAVFGLFKPGETAPRASWRFASVRDRTAEDWFAVLLPNLEQAGVAPEQIDSAIIASVVPAMTRSLRDLFARLLDVEPVIVHADLDLGIKIDVDEPYEVGADRLVNAAYGYGAFGGPTMIVDLGTATKFEAITADGHYRGGAIAPGLMMSLEVLASRAARLYAVELLVPPRVTARTTTTAVQAGVVVGHLAMIEGIVGRMAEELGPPQQVILTGGYSSIVAGHSAVFSTHEPELTIRGLAYLHHRVTGR
jgi:type III pantothenate kinase